MSTATPATGKHISGHVSTPTSRQTHPQPCKHVHTQGQSVHMQTDASLATSAPPQAGKHVPGYTNASASTLHREYFFSICFVSLTMCFPAHSHCPPCPIIDSLESLGNRLMDQRSTDVCQELKTAWRDLKTPQKPPHSPSRSAKLCTGEPEPGEAWKLPHASETRKHSYNVQIGMKMTVKTPGAPQEHRTCRALKTTPKRLKMRPGTSEHVLRTRNKTHLVHPRSKYLSFQVPTPDDGVCQYTCTA